jgi:hypothetical protein
MEFRRLERAVTDSQVIASVADGVFGQNTGEPMSLDPGECAFDVCDYTGGEARASPWNIQTTGWPSSCGVRSGVAAAPGYRRH